MKNVRLEGYIYAYNFKLKMHKKRLLSFEFYEKKPIV